MRLKSFITKLLIVVEFFRPIICLAAPGDITFKFATEMETNSCFDAQKILRLTVEEDLGRTRKTSIHEFHCDPRNSNTLRLSSKTNDCSFVGVTLNTDLKHIIIKSLKPENAFIFQLHENGMAHFRGMNLAHDLSLTTFGHIILNNESIVNTLSLTGTSITNTNKLFVKKVLNCTSNNKFINAPEGQLIIGENAVVNNLTGDFENQGRIVAKNNSTLNMHKNNFTNKKIGQDKTKTFRMQTNFEGRFSILDVNSFLNEGDIMPTEKRSGLSELLIDANSFMNFGRVWAEKQLWIKSNDFYNNGIIHSKENLIIKVLNDLINDEHGLINGNRTSVSVDGKTRNQNILSGDYFYLMTGGLENNGKVIIRNDGTLIAKDKEFGIQNGQNGIIISFNTLRLIASKLLNKGDENAYGYIISPNLILLLEELENHGGIIAQIDSFFRTGHVVNKDQGYIYCPKETAIISDWTENFSPILGEKVKTKAISYHNFDTIISDAYTFFDVENDFTNEETGHIYAKTDAYFRSGGKVENKYSVIAGNTIGVETKARKEGPDFINSGYYLSDDIILKFHTGINKSLEEDVKSLEGLIAHRTISANIESEFHSFDPIFAQLGINLIGQDAMMISDDEIATQGTLYGNLDTLVSKKRVLAENAKIKLKRLVNLDDFMCKNTLVMNAKEGDNEGNILSKILLLVGIENDKAFINKKTIHGVETVAVSGEGTYVNGEDTISQASLIAYISGLVNNKDMAAQDIDAFTQYIENNHILAAVKNMLLHTDSGVNNKIITAETLSLFANELFKNKGNIATTLDMMMQGCDFDNDGKMDIGRLFKAVLEKFNNSNDLKATNANLQTEIMGNSGTIGIEEKLKASGMLGHNTGTMLAGLMKLAYQDFQNHKNMHSQTDLSVNGQSLLNTGNMTAVGKFIANLVSLNNAETLLAKSGDLSVKDLLNSGYMKFEEALKATGETGINAGIMMAELIELAYQTFTNHTDMHSETDMVFKGGSVQNKGDMTAIGKFIATLVEFTNEKSLTATKAHITVDKFNNTDEVKIEEALTGTIGEGANAGNIAANTIDVIIQTILKNLGKISGEVGIRLTGDGELQNEEEISETQCFASHLKKVLNSGVIKTYQSIILDSLTEELKNNGLMLSKFIDLKSVSDLINKGIIEGRDGEVLIEMRELINDGLISSLNGTLLLALEKGVNNNKISADAAKLILGGIFINNKSIDIAKDFEIEKGQRFDNQGDMTIGNRFKAILQSFNNAKNLTAKNADLHAKNVVNGGNMKVEETLTVRGETGQNAGDMLANMLKLIFKKFTNDKNMHANTDMHIEGPAFDNNGNATSAGTLTAEVGALNNTKTIGAKCIELLTKSFNSSGNMHAEETLTARGETGQNAGDMLANMLKLFFKQFTNDKNMHANTDMHVEGPAFDNNGNATSAGTLTAKVGALNNTKKMAAKNMNLKADSLRSSGDISAAETLTATVGIGVNKKNIDANILDLTVRDDFTNDKNMSGKASVILKGEGSVINNENLTSNGAINIANNRLINHKNMQAETVSIGNGSALANTKNGTVLAKNMTAQEGSHVNSQGILSAQENINFYQPYNTVEGTLEAGKDINLFNTPILKTTKKSVLKSLGGKINIPNLKALDNEGDIISKESIDLPNLDKLHNKESIASDDAIVLTARDSIINEKDINGKKGVTLTARTINHTGHTQSADGTVTLRGQALELAGKISGKNIDIFSDKAPLSLGNIVLEATETVTLHVPYGWDLGGNDFEVPFNLIVIGYIINPGKLTFAKSFTFHNTQSFINKNEFFVKEKFTLTTPGLFENHGNFQVLGGCDLSAAGFVNRGNYFSQRGTDFKLSGGRLDNYSFMEIVDGWIVKGSDVENHPGAQIYHHNSASIVKFDVTGSVINHNATVLLDGYFSMPKGAAFINKAAATTSKRVWNSWPSAEGTAYLPAIRDIPSVPHSRAYFAARSMDINSAYLENTGSTITTQEKFSFNGQSYLNVTKDLREIGKKIEVGSRIEYEERVVGIRRCCGFKTGNKFAKFPISVATYTEVDHNISTGVTFPGQIYSRGQISLKINGVEIGLAQNAYNNGDIQAYKIDIASAVPVLNTQLKNFEGIPQTLPTFTPLSDHWDDKSLAANGRWKEADASCGFTVVPKNPAYKISQAEIAAQGMSSAQYLWETMDQVPPRIATLGALIGTERMHFHPAIVGEKVARTLLETIGYTYVEGGPTDAMLQARVLEENGYVNARNCHQLPPVPATPAWHTLTPAEQLAQQQKEPVTHAELDQFPTLSLVYQSTLAFDKPVLSAQLVFPQAMRQNFKPEHGRMLAHYLTIQAPSLKTTGTLKGTEALLAAIEGDLICKRGTIAGGLVRAKVGGTIANLSGKFEADRLHLEAMNIVGQTLMKRKKIDEGARQGYQDILDAQATFTTRKEMSMAAAQAMVFINAALESGENMDLLAQTMLFKALAQSSQVSMEWGENYTRSFTQTQHKTTVQSGADINMRTTGNFTTQGVKVEAANNLNVDAGGEINIEGSTSINESSYSETTEGGIFEDDDVYSGSSSSHHHEGDVLASGSSGSGRTTMSSKDRQTYTGAHLSGPQAARLLSESTIHLNAGESSYCSQDLSQSGNIFMKHNSNSGYQSITHSMCKFSVTPEIQARQGIRISLTDSLDALGQDPKTAWIKGLSLTTDVEWVHLQNAYKEWDYETNQLSAPAAALIAIGIGFATGGAGSAFTGAIGLAAGSTSATITGAMVTAAVSSVATQATVSLINNNFDLGATFKSLGSNDFLKSLLTSVVTAGLIAGVCPTAAAGSNTAAGAKDNLACFITHAKKNIIRTGVSGAINGKFDFVDMLKNIAVDTVGELAANEIGINRESHGYWTHKIEHGLLGAGLGAVLRHDDPAKGMIAGAAGAIVSEVVAEACARDMSGDMLDAYKKDAKEKGLPITREGFQAVLDSKVESIKKLAQLGGAAAAAIAGDVDVGSRMANNAIENNFAFVAVPWLVGAGMVAYSAYEINETFKRDGVEAALIHLGFEVVGYAAGAKVWGMAGKTGVAALEYVLAKSPFLKTLLGKTGDKMAEYLGAAAATPLGQKVIQANAAVEAGARQFAVKVEEKLGPRFAFAGGAPGGDAAKAVTAVKPNGGGAAKPAPKPKAESSPASSSQPECSSSGSSSSSSSSAPASSTSSAKQKASSSSAGKETGRVRKINDRMPINAEYAGKVYPLEKLPKSLRQKYPHSVPFTGTGHPDFSRYAIKKVEIKVTGDHNIDFSLADKVAGIVNRNKNYTWHHHHDGKSMYLIPKDIHKAVRHTGGAAVVKVKK